MIEDKFSAAVVVSAACTNNEYVPESMAKLIEAAQDLKRKVADTIGICESFDVDAPACDEAIQEEIEKHWSGVQEFKRVMVAYMIGSGYGKALEARWSNTQGFAEALIQPSTAEI